MDISDTIIGILKLIGCGVAVFAIAVYWMFLIHLICCVTIDEKDPIAAGIGALLFKDKKHNPKNKDNP